MKLPLIIDIKGHSLDDGPGIRSVVFIKGCPLRCSWCQNPESQRATAELSWDREKCIGCGTCVETCGQFDRDCFENLIFPWIDTIYMDIKIVDRKKHQDHCGIPNDLILENFAWLCRRAASGEVALLPRTPLIPGITDSDAQIAELVGLYTKHEVQKASLLGNNPIWIDKCDQLGIPAKPGTSSNLRDFYSPKNYEAIRSLFNRDGITIVSS
jgi:pyruvate formate lyase activating enzyme